MHSAIITSGLIALTTFNIAAAIPILNMSQTLGRGDIKFIQPAQPAKPVMAVSNPQQKSKVALAFSNDLTRNVPKNFHPIHFGMPVATLQPSGLAFKADKTTSFHRRGEAGTPHHLEDHNGAKTTGEELYERTSAPVSIQSRNKAGTPHHLEEHDCVATTNGALCERTPKPDSAQHTQANATPDSEDGEDCIATPDGLICERESAANAAESEAKLSEVERREFNDHIDTLNDIVDERIRAALSGVSWRATAQAGSASEKEKECIDTLSGCVCTSDHELLAGVPSIGDCKEGSIGC